MIDVADIFSGNPAFPDYASQLWCCTVTLTGNNMNREAEIKAMIADVMHRNASKLKGYKVFLFGSRATGQSKQRSDFDIGVLGEDALPLSVFFDIEDQLDALPTLYKLDWVDFSKASDRFRKRAMQQIEVLYE